MKNILTVAFLFALSSCYTKATIDRHDLINRYNQPFKLTVYYQDNTSETFSVKPVDTFGEIEPVAFSIDGGEHIPKRKLFIGL